MLMLTSTMATGGMIKRMDVVYSHVPMEMSTTEAGVMTCQLMHQNLFLSLSHPLSNYSAAHASHSTSAGSASASSIVFVALQMKLFEGLNSIVIDGTFTAAHAVGYVLLKVRLLRNTYAAKARYEYNMMHRFHHIALGCFVRPSVCFPRGVSGSDSTPRQGR